MRVNEHGPQNLKDLEKTVSDLLSGILQSHQALYERLRGVTLAND